MAGIVRRSCGCGRDPRGQLRGHKLIQANLSVGLFRSTPAPRPMSSGAHRRAPHAAVGPAGRRGQPRGAAGMLGSAFVAKSPPDGYTLLQANIAPNAISVSLYAKVPYDQLRDFAPITRIGMTPNIITVHPSVPFKSIKQFIAYAKAHPGQAELLRRAGRHLAAADDGVAEIAGEVRCRAHSLQDRGASGHRYHGRPGSGQCFQRPGDHRTGSGRTLARACGHERAAYLAAAGRADDAGIRRSRLRGEFLVWRGCTSRLHRRRCSTS